jgi:hypothetical protein
MAPKINVKKNSTDSSERLGIKTKNLDHKKLNISFIRIMIKSPRCSKIILESLSKRVRFHSKVGIGA